MINFAFSHPKRFEDKGEGRWHLGGSSRVILMDGGIPWEDVAACVNLLGEEYPRLGAAAQLRNVDALPGDLVIVHRQENFRNGDIVVALFEDEATVKTFQRKDGHVWLLPENPEYQPIDGTYAEIIGKVVAVVRRY